MRTTLRRIGNSIGLIIPKALLVEAGLTRDVTIEMKSNALIIQAAPDEPRAGWAEAAKELASTGEDALIWPEFSNVEDEALQW